ncbi:carbon-nitrogen hydrolase family protein [Acidithiobacillus sp. AMEEHan]|uniref:carbon-nitrogen hydrolase family protein n=1 Tax=Acidithiobacillus sp. AMEEHan TaxID=2994951 RepID=UPI0027E4D81E|nr:carbon-nitrogen hydrolase family protein [Acidithiobacillus sp. AMEEHan]
MNGPSQGPGTAEGKLLCAVVQTVSSANLEQNLAAAGEAIRNASSAGAKLVLLPENFAFMGQRDTDKLTLMEDPGQGPIQDFLAEQAAQYGIWLLGGSIPLRAPDGRCFASLLVYDAQGRMQARYDKIHLFDVDLAGGESYRESATIMPGAQPVLVASPWGGIGLSICYDLRFPELYRHYAGASLLVVPSAFTVQTGRAHWETLLRARAIENQAFVLAADQGGKHANGRETWGHSMIIDPWGQILALQEKGAGIALAELDLGQLSQIRTRLPALRHRRL